MFPFYHSIVGNASLEKWSRTSLRRAGLCEDHFTTDSFNPNSNIKGLKKNAVPVPFDLSVPNNSKSDNGKRTNLNETEAYQADNITRQSESENDETNVASALTSISENMATQEQLQEPPLKTYISKLNFDNSDEDISEWLHLEPDMHKETSTAIAPNYVQNVSQSSMPFEFNVAQNNVKTYNRKRKNLNKTEAYRAENITRQSQSKNNETNITSALTSISDNMSIEEQLQEPPIKTYKSWLNDCDSSEEEDDNKWTHLESPMHNKNLENRENIRNKKRNNKQEQNNDHKNVNNSNIVQSLQRKISRLQNHIRTLKYKLRTARRYRIPKTQKQNKKLVKQLINKQDLHPIAKTMINLQLHPPRTPYTQEEKNLARQLYYYSPSAFCRLRKAGCNLPGQRTIRKWLEEHDIISGFCDFIFKKLKDKLSQLPLEERVCALKWDEMSIKSYEEYSQKLDQIEGLVDLGPLGRKSDRCKCVFVFCLDSLNAHHPWRQPLAYFLPGKCMKAEEIVVLIKECLDRLNEAGADVQLLTCDQGTSNQSACAQLNITTEKPYFTHNGKTYYASFDFPHLIKRLTSFFRKHTTLYCDGKIIASYTDIEMTWSIDNATKGGSNLLSHITEAHIRPNNFEAMRVNLAFQLLSHSMGCAIKTAGNENELDTETWEATADFAERMNNIIDACNSYSIKMRFGGKRPLSSKNPDLIALLTDFTEWCSRWSKSPNNVTQMPCFRGLVLTVRAILATYEKLSNQFQGFELATGLCNQDSVEHLFSKLRQRGGHNPNPTARMVRLSMRHILSTGYIQTSDKGNVECPESEALITQPSQLMKEVEKVMRTSTSTVEYADFEDESYLEDAQLLEKYANYENIENIENITPLSGYNENAIAYFAGFVAQRSLKKTKCENCRNDMMKTPMDDATANEKYIEYREYSDSDDEDAPTVKKLIRPTTVLTNITKTQLKTFNHTWENHWASNHVLENIVAACVQATNRNHAGWLDTSHECYNHRMEALKYLIRVKTYSRTRYNNRAEKIKSNKKYTSKRKMKNILNK